MTAPVPAAARPPRPSDRRLPVTELIAGGALVALVAWGVIQWSGLAARPVSLGPLDPGRFFPGRGLVLADLPLVLLLLAGGIPLVGDLVAKLVTGTFGSDLLAGISIVTSMLLGEYLAGVLVVLMLSGGEALERRAVSRAGDVLAALARRMPALAHRRADGQPVDVPLAKDSPANGTSASIARLMSGSRVACSRLPIRTRPFPVRLPSPSGVAFFSCRRGASPSPAARRLCRNLAGGSGQRLWMSIAGSSSGDA